MVFAIEMYLSSIYLLFITILIGIYMIPVVPLITRTIFSSGTALNLCLSYVSGIDTACARTFRNAGQNLVVRVDF